MRSARWLLPLGPAVSVSSHSLAASEFCPVLCIFLKLFDLLLASCMGELLLFLLDLLAKQSLLVASPKLKLAGQPIMRTLPPRLLLLFGAHSRTIQARLWVIGRCVVKLMLAALVAYTVGPSIHARRKTTSMFPGACCGTEHPCAQDDNVHVHSAHLGAEHPCPNDEHFHAPSAYCGTEHPVQRITTQNIQSKGSKHRRDSFRAKDFS